MLSDDERKNERNRQIEKMNTNQEKHKMKKREEVANGNKQKKKH